ncbi:MAG: sigma-70 family RNA polymerase sigma factor [Verrucomicrobia bacterium]|nr:sigma-70 family RNA polymerase sigma factor [Verrucomicrobiota bacterium]MBU1908903.1 sigma-70 family RNA polymerase sigma factor [Verrucomicrobiota bacterium]
MQSEDKGIKIYLREIGQTALLTREDEVKLARRIKRGDEEARQLMIRANLRLVVKIAHDYAQYGLPLLDLISEGNIGLMKAVTRFDPKKGGKLSTYAAWWIKQSIKRALANQSKTIRLPSHLVDKISRMRRAERGFAQKHGRDPTEAELAKAAGVSVTTIRMWQTVSLRPASLNAPIGDEDSAEYGDIIGDDRNVSPAEDISDRQLKGEIEGLLDQLGKREREILMYRYGLRGVKPETLEVVGRRFKITRERVRQIQNSTVLRLRQMLEDLDQPQPRTEEKEESP